MQKKITTALLLFLIALQYYIFAIPENGASILLQSTAVKQHNYAHVMPANEPIEKFGIGLFTSDTYLHGTYLYSDADDSLKLNYRKIKIPKKLDGQIYIIADSKKSHSWICTESGNATIVLPISENLATKNFLESGFQELGSFKLSDNTEFIFLSKLLKKGEKLLVTAGAILSGIELSCNTSMKNLAISEVLYNSIVLQKYWPPKIDINSNEPMPVPYLENPPDCIDISVGRQLFVDDFLLAKLNRVTRSYHQPKKYEGNPIFKPETELEKNSICNNNPVAAPLSGSILWNPNKKIFEMWYEAGHITNLAYAYSIDGIHFVRPNIKNGSNKIVEQQPDSWSVYYDYEEADKSKVYKMFMRSHDLNMSDKSEFYTSHDGINWKFESLGGKCGDRSTLFYNPFRKKWVASLRWGVKEKGRCRAYWEGDSFFAAMNYNPVQPVFWTAADKLDLLAMPNQKKAWKNQLYNLDAVAYESIMLGIYQIMYGGENRDFAKDGVPKRTALSFAYSRDGFHWYRPDRRAAIDSTHSNTWDMGYVQSISNICTIVGDKLYIYYTGFAGDPTKKVGVKKADGKAIDEWNSGLYANGATGVAFLRRDGFASLDSLDNEGFIQTRLVKFLGKFMFANINSKNGYFKVQICDKNGKPIEPFTFQNCKVLVEDSTITKVEWCNAGDCNLSAISGREVIFQFKMKNANFYSFWVSKDMSGRSDGYLAGGGPGYTSNKDIVGKSK